MSYLTAHPAKISLISVYFPRPVLVSQLHPALHLQSCTWGAFSGGRTFILRPLARKSLSLSRICSRSMILSSIDFAAISSLVWGSLTTGLSDLSYILLISYLFSDIKSEGCQFSLQIISSLSKIHRKPWQIRIITFSKSWLSVNLLRSRKKIFYSIKSISKCLWI